MTGRTQTLTSTPTNKKASNRVTGFVVSLVVVVGTMKLSLCPSLLSTSSLLLLLVLRLPEVQSQACTGPRQRKAWNKLTSTEQTDYLNAVNLLKEHTCANCNSVPSYDDFVRVHSENALAAHSIQELIEEFLPWHRWYIWKYETALQIVSNDPCLTLPYWEWELDSGNESASDPLQATTFGSTNGIIKGGNPQNRYIVTEGIADCYDSSGIWSTTVGTGSCLQRSFGQGYTFTSQVGLINRIVDPANSVYSGFFLDLEGTPHAVPHNWVGRHMANARVSPDDPLFFLHHCNVDRVWALWQDYRNHDQISSASLGVNEFSSNLDAPMSFGLAAPRDDSYFKLNGAFPTPRQVLLNNNGLIQVTYVEDTLAYALQGAMGTSSYTPNPDWFTLPDSNPVPSPTASPVDSGNPPPDQCGLNRDPCPNGNSDCCSLNCKSGLCKGNRRMLRELAGSNSQGPPIWANPKAQLRWEELSSTLPPQAALRRMAIEECGADNPVQVSQEWLDQMPGIDIKYFRCYVE